MATLPFPFVAKDEDELWHALVVGFGLRYPRTKVCEHHVAPFKALADAYFARYPIVVVWASRGFGGKSTLLAGLSLMELLAGADVVLLGGSGQQSRRVHEVTKQAWRWKFGEFEAPTYIIKKSTVYETQTIAGNWMRALMASPTSVRGPHPQRLRLDEVDEMSLDIYDAALGQPLAAKGIPSQTLVSSTMQYADGTMAEVMRRAQEKGHPVYSWCWRETHVSNGGWVTDAMIEDARQRVSKAMWELEFELGEPTTEGIAFDPESLESCFYGSMIEEKPGRVYTFEDPMPGELYVTAADWAQEKDYTVIITFKVDETNHTAKLVAYERSLREPWPAMVERFNRRVANFPGKAIHDATGLGGVIDDYLTIKSYPFVFSGNTKPRLLSSYQLAIEHGRLMMPRLSMLYKDHRNCTVEDLFGRGHVPDSVSACALAWALIDGIAKRTKRTILKPRTF